LFSLFVFKTRFSNQQYSAEFGAEPFTGEVMDKLERLKFCVAAVFVLATGILAGCGGSHAAPGPVSASGSRFAVGGTLSGLARGASVTINNGSDSISMQSNGSFAFPVKLEKGASYNVTAVNPTGHICTVKDGVGNVGTADVTKISIACTAMVLAGVEGAVKSPVAVAIDANDNTFVLDTANQVIVKFTKAGIASTLAGSKGVRGSQDGVGGAASFHFSQHSSAAVDAQGNLLVSDSCNGLLRKVTPSGVVSTIAGARGPRCKNYINGEEVQPVDGTGAAAVFVFPSAIAIAKNGDVLVADDVAAFVRRVTPAGVVTTENYFAESVYQLAIQALAFDKNGALYVATGAGANKVWKVQDGQAVFLAGGSPWQGSPSLPSDGTGAAVAFLTIVGIAADSSGNLFVADGHSIRRMTPGGTVTTIAGGVDSGTANGRGAAAGFGVPSGIGVDSSGNAVVSQYDQSNLRVVTPTGDVSTFGGTPNTRDYVDGAGAEARFDNASALAAGSDGTLYTIDTVKHVIRKVSPTGDVSLFAGIPGTKGGVNGPLAVATFNVPRAIAVDKNDIVYVADANGIRKIAAGVVSLLADTRLNGAVFALAADADGNVAASMSIKGTVLQISPAGAVTTIVDRFQAMAALNLQDKFGIFLPQGIVYDAAGNLYISDTGNIVVYKFSKAGTLALFAGTPTVEGDADGPVGTATFGFYSLDWMTADAAGNLYLSGQGKLRKISPTGLVSTPSLAWGNPNLLALAYQKGVLYGMTSFALMQLPVE
jgi:sugar lactone lactonase YvrE